MNIKLCTLDIKYMNTIKLKDFNEDDSDVAL